MTQDGKVSIGVVGLGLWGQNHCVVFDDYHRAELAVVCDVDEAKAKAAAERFGCDWTTDVAELASSDVEAFGIATPDPFHFAPTKALLEAGKHVLLEKPLTTDLDEARQLTALAEASDSCTMIDYHLRWDPQWCMIKDAVERGDLGALTMAYVRLSDAIEVAQNWLSWAGRSGPHWFLFPHTMDLIRWISGGVDPEVVFAMGQKGVLAEHGVDTFDCLQAMVSFGDFQATFETSWIVPDSAPSVLDWHATINGSKGKVDYDPDYTGIAFSTDKYRFPWADLGQRNRYGRLDHYLYEPMRYFVDCVADGVTPEATFRDGLVGVAMVHAVLQSIESGQPVQMRDLL